MRVPTPAELDEMLKEQPKRKRRNSKRTGGQRRNSKRTNYAAMALKCNQATLELVKRVNGKQQAEPVEAIPFQGEPWPGMTEADDWRVTP